MITSLEKIYDNRRSDSFVNSLRKKRMDLFNSLLANLEHSVKILDLGGRPIFWENTFFEEKGFCDQKNLEIMVVNIKPDELKNVKYPNIKTMVGDARYLNQFGDKEFDVVFSNSLIEHVGDYENQRQMANEVMRVGKRYFVQTPNLYFPIEPHFLLPFFQFFPEKLQVWVLMNIGAAMYTDKKWIKYTDPEKALARAKSAKLLSKKQLMELFPGGQLWEEKMLGLTKSFIIYGGW